MQGSWQRGEARAAPSPPGYCHGSEWLMGSETRARDCSIIAAEHCPWGLSCTIQEHTIVCIYTAGFVKAASTKCTHKQTL